MYRSAANSEYGELYGLDIRSLTPEQLSSIKFTKLIEFIDKDDRVEGIISNSIKHLDAKDAALLFKRFDSIEDISKHSMLLSSYNEYLKKHDAKMSRKAEKDYNFPSRYNFVKWAWLNEQNKDAEVVRFIDNKSSILSGESIDYSWLYNHKPELAVSFARTVMEKSYTGYRWRGSQQHLVATMPKEMMPEFMYPLFKDKKKYRLLTFYALSNLNTPHKYIVQAVRNISRNKDLPQIKVTLGKKVWGDIPTVTRLNCMESILYHAPNKHSLDFGDIKTEDDIRQLMFSALLKYYDRVERLLKVFSQRYLTKE